MSDTFKRAILHIDGDAFFASCEQASHSHLKNACIVIGQERGIASAFSYSAKARGVIRGMPIQQVKRICPEAIILPGNYDLYQTYAKRMYAIVKRFTPHVEEYSIDECFADITGMDRVCNMSYEDIGRIIKQTLEDELGITFSIGLASNKVLAKIGSTWDKPSGYTIIYPSHTQRFLKQKPIGDIWGIGKQTASFLIGHNIITAYDFVLRPRSWVIAHMTKPYHDIYDELSGIFRLPLLTKTRDTYKSISATRTFTPSSSNRAYIFSELSRNVERACKKARHYNIQASRVSIFIKDNAFQYFAIEYDLAVPTYAPAHIIDSASVYFERIFQSGKVYRFTGVTFTKLIPKNYQRDLFGYRDTVNTHEYIADTIDAINDRLGSHAIYIASSHASFQAHTKRHDLLNQSSHISTQNNRHMAMIKKLYIPWIGEV